MTPIHLFAALIQFEPQITLGNVLTVITMVGGTFVISFRVGTYIGKQNLLNATLSKEVEASRLVSENNRAAIIELQKDNVALKMNIAFIKDRVENIGEQMSTIDLKVDTTLEKTTRIEDEQKHVAENLKLKT